MFRYDSSIMSFLSKVADLAILNFLTLLFCIPIVTIGASVTAAHYAALKMRRGEGYVASNFWKSFKVNLAQSTGIFIIFAIQMFLAINAIWFFTQIANVVASILCGVILVVLVFTVVIWMWVLPLQSRFVNTIRRTIKNAFLLGLKYLFRTIAMVLVTLASAVALYRLPPQWMSIWLIFGLSIPTYVSAVLYDKPFEKLEDIILEQEQETTKEDSIEEQISM